MLFLRKNIPPSAFFFNFFTVSISEVLEHSALYTAASWHAFTRPLWMWSSSQPPGVCHDVVSTHPGASCPLALACSMVLLAQLLLPACQGRRTAPAPSSGQNDSPASWSNEWHSVWNWGKIFFQQHRQGPSCHMNEQALPAGSAYFQCAARRGIHGLVDVSANCVLLLSDSSSRWAHTGHSGEFSTGR